MGAPTGVDVEAMRAENEQLRKEREELRSTIEELNGRVCHHAILNIIIMKLIHPIPISLYANIFRIDLHSFKKLLKSNFSDWVVCLI